MRRIISTGLFAIVTLAVAIAGDRLFSLISGLESGQAFIAALSWISLVFGWHKFIATQDNGSVQDDRPEDTIRDESADADGDEDASQQRDVDYQTQPTPLGGISDDDTTDSTPDTTTSSRQLTQSSLLRSNDEIIDEVEDKLDDYVQVYNDGSIEISDNDLNLYSRMMLEVIVKRLKYEYGSTDTPMMTVEELEREMDDKGFDYNRMEVVLFLDMAGGRLTPSHNVTLWTRDDYDDLENIEFSVGLKKLSEITDWALEEQRSSPLDLSIGLGNAAGWLSDASDTYSEMKKEQRTASYYNPEEDFETICDHVLTACSDAKAYPVEIGRDSNWKKFTYYSEGVLKGVDSISHHLPRAQKYLENMQNIAEEERGW